MFNIFLGLIMVAALVGMVLCAKKQSTNSNAKPAAIGLCVVVVVCAIFLIVPKGGGASSHLSSEVVFLKSSAYILGQKLAELTPGAKVLYLVNMRDKNNAGQNAMIEGFKEGSGSAITDIKVVAIHQPKKLKTSTKKSPSDEMREMAEMEAMELFTAKDFNAILAKNRDYNLIVTTIGLPSNLEDMSIWSLFEKNPKVCPKLVLLNGSTPNMGFLLEAGLIKAVVCSKPQADYNQLASSNMQESFDTRYLLATKGNIKQMTQQYPRIFKTK